jgi:hypothetical protein
MDIAYFDHNGAILGDFHVTILTSDVGVYTRVLQYFYQNISAFKNLFCDSVLQTSFNCSV